MKTFLKLAFYHDNKGNYSISDYIDNNFIKVAKSDDGSDLSIEGIEWKNPKLSPEELQRIESAVYPEGFHYYGDIPAEKMKRKITELPPEKRTLKTLKKKWLEDAISDETDKVIVDGEPGQFYFVIEIDDEGKTIEIADLTVMTKEQMSSENAKKNVKANAFFRISKALFPYIRKGYFIKADLRDSTSWPVIQELEKRKLLTRISHNEYYDYDTEETMHGYVGKLQFDLGMTNRLMRAVKDLVPDL